MADTVVLGVHSNKSGGAGLDYTGHAWITITRNGVTTTYGLWSDNHVDKIPYPGKGPESDIRKDREQSETSVASRYYQLTPKQIEILEQELKQNVTWGYTNNCASWVSKVGHSVLGKTLDAKDYY